VAGGVLFENLMRKILIGGSGLPDVRNVSLGKGVYYAAAAVLDDGVSSNFCPAVLSMPNFGWADAYADGLCRSSRHW
jgi:hypothetical protein